MAKVADGHRWACVVVGKVAMGKCCCGKISLWKNVAVHLAKCSLCYGWMLPVLAKDVVAKSYMVGKCCLEGVESKCMVGKCHPLLQHPVCSAKDLTRCIWYIVAYFPHWICNVDGLVNVMHIESIFFAPWRRKRERSLWEKYFGRSILGVPFLQFFNSLALPTAAAPQFSLNGS